MSQDSNSFLKKKKWIISEKEKWLADYFDFLRIPSISSEPEHKDSILKCANWIIDFLKPLNFKIELWETEGHPVIFASNLEAGPEKPTLLIYNHYDVQPVDPLEEWKSPPFEPVIHHHEVFARGAQDNKGQCFYVLQALRMLYEENHSYPLNIKLCIEGEEEIGSAGLAHLLPKKKNELHADYLAIVDLGLPKEDQPALTLGLRGILTLDLALQGSEIDLHSGSNGGIVVNPIHALVRMLADLRDERGRIKIPEFYSKVDQMSEEERSFVSFDFDEKSYQQQIGAQPLGGELDFPVMERAWLRPTLEINGIWGGYTGKGFKTVIPAKAFAKISCRLVPHQDPVEIGKILTKYFHDHVPNGMKISVQVHPGHGEAVRVSPKSTVVSSFAKAFEEVFGKPCAFIYEGASIPIVPELSKASQAETILLGLGLITDQIHAPNEHFGIDRIEKGILIMARAIELLAKLDHC